MKALRYLGPGQLAIEDISRCRQFLASCYRNPQYLRPENRTRTGVMRPPPSSQTCNSLLSNPLGTAFSGNQ